MSFSAWCSFFMPSLVLPEVHSLPPSVRRVLASAALASVLCLTMAWSNCFSSAAHLSDPDICAAIAGTTAIVNAAAIGQRKRLVIDDSLQKPAAIDDRSA